MIFFPPPAPVEEASTIFSFAGSFILSFFFSTVEIGPIAPRSRRSQLLFSRLTPSLGSGEHALSPYHIYLGRPRLSQFLRLRHRSRTGLPLARSFFIPLLSRFVHSPPPSDFSPVSETESSVGKRTKVCLRRAFPFAGFEEVTRNRRPNG